MDRVEIVGAELVVAVIPETLIVPVSNLSARRSLYSYPVAARNAFAAKDDVPADHRLERGGQRHIPKGFTEILFFVLFFTPASDTANKQEAREEAVEYFHET